MCVFIINLSSHLSYDKDPSALQISRLTFVDLAGSERTKHTQTTGDRLKEAGNINKSLMVLGQCMEAMRSNQRRSSHPHPTKKPSEMAKQAVPFWYSKVTELFQDFFEGDGRVVSAHTQDSKCSDPDALDRQ